MFVESERVSISTTDASSMSGRTFAKKKMAWVWTRTSIYLGMHPNFQTEQMA